MSRVRKQTLLVACLAWTATSACEASRSEVRESTIASEGLTLIATLGGLDTAGYARALEPRTFVFPQDHGPHPDFRTEWWYVTGNLSSDDGRAFGFQFTIFRNALAPNHPGGPSAWSTNQAYMGHFTFTDIAASDFRMAEVFSRGGAGLAGAESSPFEVWIEDWALRSVERARPPEVTRALEETGAVEVTRALDGEQRGSVFPLRLSADGPNVDLDLELFEGKPVVLHGQNGLSQKGPERGNASFYYAHTRLPARGSVVLDGDTLQLSGLAWLDREWSTSALSEGQVGWDWFALQLEDGWELMVYQLRRADGSIDRFSDGALIDPGGRRFPLVWGTDVMVEATGAWASPFDGARYPSGWRVRVPARGWELDVQPAILDQELRVTFRYWEGAVHVTGQGEGGAPVVGRGFVELTGYSAGGG